MVNYEFQLWWTINPYVAGSSPAPGAHFLSLFRQETPHGRYILLSIFDKCQV